jgi:hypothetical protein
VFSTTPKYSDSSCKRVSWLATVGREVRVRSYRIPPFALTQENPKCLAVERSGRLLCDSFRRIIATVLTVGKGLFREAGPR